MTPALEVRDLRKAYPPRLRFRDFLLPWKREAPARALQGVTFDVAPGEIFGLLGPNGAGKTTLLKIVCTMILPDEGTVRVEGREVSLSEREVKARIGFVPSDERSFYWRLTGRQNLEFFGRLHGLSGMALRTRIADVLELLEMQGEADRQFMAYSSGMKQRLAIARGLLHDPDLLLLDEPTRSLDPSAAHALRALLRERMNRALGKTILLCTHNLAEAASLCGRVALLHRGRAIRCGPPGEVLQGTAGRFFRVVAEGASPERIAEADLPARLAALHGGGRKILSIEEELVPLEESFEAIVRGAGAGDA